LIGDHRVGPVLTITVGRDGVVIPICKKLTNRYMNLEAEGMKRAAESA